jgi:hypothetical protein
MATAYRAYNAVLSNTAAPTRVTTGTAIKTLLQIGVPSTRPITVISWGISFDGVTPTNVPVPVELVQTDYAATVTGVTPGVWGNQTDAPPSLCVSGTSATGHTASAEGSASGTNRLLDYVDLTPNGGAFVRDYPLGREPIVPISKFLRIRTTAANAVNAICYITWEE